MRGAWGAAASFFFSMVKVAASFLLLPTCAFAGSWRPSERSWAAATATGCSGRISQERIYPFHARASRKGVRPPRLPWFLHVSLHFRGCFGVRYPPSPFPCGYLWPNPFALRYVQTNAGVRGGRHAEIRPGSQETSCICVSFYAYFPAGYHSGRCFRHLQSAPTLSSMPCQPRIHSTMVGEDMGGVLVTRGGI